jgi:hypothetical protein
MYLFLLAFGAVVSLAGVILAASGLSISDHTFDASLVTPGIVAIVGGLLLVGLGFALRVLQRIQHALETQPHAAPAGAPLEPAAVAVSEAPSETSRIPFPVRIPRPQQTAAAAEPAPPAEKHLEELPLKFPKVARSGPAPVPDDIETSPKLPLSAALGDADEPAAESAGPLLSRTFKARYGATPAARTSPRLDRGARPPLTTQRPAGSAFEALWPKAPRRAAAQAQAAPELPAAARRPLMQEPIVHQHGAQQHVAQQHAAEEPVVSEPAEQQPAADDAAFPKPDAAERPVAVSTAVARDAEPEEGAEPLSVLKSGIVDGMAYTLYSDGSIEAQLPQGILRFGSISELRAHIEQDTQSS